MSEKAGRLTSKMRMAEAQKLMSQGLSPGEVAQRLGVSLRTVHRWKEGMGEVKASLSGANLGPGRPGGLTEAQSLQLHEALLKGKRSLGLPSGPWKTEEILRIVAFFYGQKVSSKSIETLLEKQGWQRLGAGQVWDKPLPVVGEKG